MMAEVYDLDYHAQIEREEAPQADRLCVWLNERYHPDRVVDFGCSTGLYLAPWHRLEIRVEGYEPSEAARSRPLIPGIQALDLCVKCTVAPAPLVLCIEVAEHIPERHADAIVENLVHATSGHLVFSAAHPNQGGRGHVNCKPKDYWLRRFEHHGFLVDIVDTVSLVDFMREGYHLGWFVQNAVILRRIRVRQFLA